MLAQDTCTCGERVGSLREEKREWQIYTDGKEWGGPREEGSVRYRCLNKMWIKSLAGEILRME